jgi:hypothetical protein
MWEVVRLFCLAQAPPIRKYYTGRSLSVVTVVPLPLKAEFEKADCVPKSQCVTSSDAAFTFRPLDTSSRQYADGRCRSGALPS